MTSDVNESDGLERVKKRIGELLIEEGLVNPGQLEEALSIQKREGGRTIDIMINCGYLDTDSYERFIGNQPSTAAISLTNYVLEPEVYQLVPKEFALEREIIPVDKLGHMLTIGMVCPIDWRTVDDVAEMTGLKVSPFLCNATELRKAHARCYGATRPRTQGN